LVTGGIDEVVKIDADKALETMGVPSEEPAPTLPELSASEPAMEGEGQPKEDEDDPMKALEEAMKKESAEKK
jgi:antitoxin component of RelBE/YafQ-DinJ toxin-antitoxin module